MTNDDLYDEQIECCNCGKTAQIKGCLGNWVFAGSFPWDAQGSGWLVTDTYPPGDNGLMYACSYECAEKYQHINSGLFAGMIIINGKQRSISTQYLSYQDIVDMEFNGAKWRRANPDGYAGYSITYRSKIIGAEGILSYDEKIKVVNDLIINVALTNNA